MVAIVVGVAVVLVVSAVIGNRDNSGETVPAGAWAQNVCGAVGVWRGEMEAIVEDIRTPSGSSGSGTEEPQSETPQGRTGFVRKGLERAVESTKTLVTGIENAGAPDTEQGEEAAQMVSDWADEALDELEQAQDTLETEADTLEEAIEQFTGATKAIGSTLASGVKTLAEVSKLDPQIGASLIGSSTCKQLREDAGE